LKTSTLIYNPIAGRRPARREREIQRAAEVLRRTGLEVKLAATSGPGAARELAAAAVRHNDDLVLVCGGDGTINEVINGLAPGPVPLAVLPGGTANILGKELRLPHDPVRAAEDLPRWSPRRIALGQASWRAPEESPPIARRYFVSVAGIGFDAHIVYRLSNELKMSWGVAGYVLEAFRQVVRYGFPPFVCDLDGRKEAATFAVVHRTRLYAGWLHLAPAANLFESRLTLCFFRSRRWSRYLLYAAAVLARRHLRLRDVEMLPAMKIECAAQGPGRPIRFELDGELVGTLPATFEVVPDALTLLAP
jgi:diacylglycerol kinase (ATP)